ncbi:MAG: hypothetical protein D9V47_03435 [Clostridia bacterium]|nr:MAG: hypothetical protein D9V47_03435 [Clostridia bacterium]
MVLKRAIKAAIIFLAVAVAVTGCQNPQQARDAREPGGSSSAEQARGGDKERIPYKIGVILTKSGPGGLLGEAEEKAINFLVEKANKESGIAGHRVDVVIYDDEGRAEIATRYFKRLIESDGVIGILGPSMTPTSLAVEPLAIENRVPTIVMTGGYYPKADTKWMFGSIHPSEQAFHKAFRYFQEHNISKMARLTPNDPLGQLGHNLAEKLAREYGLEMVATEYFNLGDVDVKAQLARLKSSRAQVVITWATGEPVAMVSRQMVEMGWDVPLFVTYGNSSRQFLKLVGAKSPVITMGAKIMVVDELPDSDPMKPVIKEYVEWHQAKYGEPPAGLTDGLGYDAFNIMLDAIKRTGKGPEELKADREVLRSAIENTKNLVGLNGIFNITPEDHIGTSPDDLIPMRIENGQWVVIK